MMRASIPASPVYWFSGGDVVSRSSGRAEALTPAEAGALHSALCSLYLKAGKRGDKPVLRYLGTIEFQLREAIARAKDWRRAA